MKLLNLIALVNIVSASLLDIQNRRCNDVVVSGYNYIKEVLKDGLDAPYQMTLDYHTNFLFFTYMESDSSSFVSAFIDLNNNEFGIIEDIRGGFATTFDAMTQTVYIGGIDGIYKFNYETRSGIKTNITDQDIWQVFAKGEIYFTTFPEEHAYVYQSGEVKQVDGIGNTNVTQIGVDDEGNVFYCNSSGLFCYTNGNTVYMGDYTVIGFTLDINRELYFTTPTGIYVIRNKFNIEKLSRIVGLYGMVVPKDGSLIYSDHDSIIKLKPDGTECIPELHAVYN